MCVLHNLPEAHASLIVGFLEQRDFPCGTVAASGPDVPIDNILQALDRPQSRRGANKVRIGLVSSLHSRI